MSYSRIRLSITNADFPLLTEFAGRTVLASAGEEKANAVEYNTVGILYCENVMPSKEGLKSIDFIQAIPPLVVPDGSYLALIQFAYDELTPTSYADLATIVLPTPYAQWGLDFVRILELRGTGEIRAYIGITSRGNLFISTPDTTSWTALNNDGWNPTLDDINSVSVATLLAGSTTDTYICLPRFKIFKVNITVKILEPIVFKPNSDIVQSNVLGIVASYNYLILHDGHTLQWSSAFDPLDFALANSLVTGAGFGTPVGLQGKITALVTNPAGFTVYSDVNAIDVDYSSNTRFPWVFRPIPNSAGVPNNRMVIVSEDNVNYAWTSQGLQAISAQNAQPIFPEVTDFLTFGKLETYDFNTNEVNVSEGDIKVDIGYAGNRYVIISYGLALSPTDAPVRFAATVGEFSGDPSTINGLAIRVLPGFMLIGSNPVILGSGPTTIHADIVTFDALEVAGYRPISWTITILSMPEQTLGNSFLFTLLDDADGVIAALDIVLTSVPITVTGDLSFIATDVAKIRLDTDYISESFTITFTSLQPTDYTQALVFDVALKRWGKIVIPHVDTVDYRIGAFNAPRSGIGFMSSTGEVSVVDFSDKRCVLNILNRDNFLVNSCTPGVWNSAFNQVESDAISVRVSGIVPNTRPLAVNTVEIHVTIYTDTATDIMFTAYFGSTFLSVTVPGIGGVPEGMVAVGTITFPTTYAPDTTLDVAVLLVDSPSSSQSPILVITGVYV